jgi:hypothetical protein
VPAEWVEQALIAIDAETWAEAEEMKREAAKAKRRGRGG